MVTDSAKIFGPAAPSRGSTQPLLINYFRNRLSRRYLGSDTTRHPSYTVCTYLNRPGLTWKAWDVCKPQIILLKKLFMAQIVKKFTFWYLYTRRLYSVRFECITFVDEVTPPLRRDVMLNAKHLENFLKGMVPSSKRWTSPRALFGMLDHEEEGTTLIRDVNNCSPVDTA